VAAIFRLRKSITGRCILQKIVEGEPLDVRWRPSAGAGVFAIVPIDAWQAAQERISAAERRADLQRKARADKRERDFQASQLPTSRSRSTKRKSDPR
jgi:hypothetical protein